MPTAPPRADLRARSLTWREKRILPSSPHEFIHPVIHVVSRGADRALADASHAALTQPPPPDRAQLIFHSVNSILLINLIRVKIIPNPFRIILF